MPKKPAKKVTKKSAPAPKKQPEKKIKRQEEVTDEQDNLIPKALMDDEEESADIAEVDPEILESALEDDDFSPDMDEEDGDEW